MIQEVSSDEVVIPQRGKDLFDGGNYIKMHKHNFDTEMYPFANFWLTSYSAINECNKILHSLTGRGAPQSFIAEVRTVRAYWYYLLLDVFGNIPVVENFDVPEGFNPSTVQRNEVFEWVRSELETNVPLLMRDHNDISYGRMNYYAGQAVLSALYLNAEIYSGIPFYEEAIMASDAIINTGEFQLEDDYFKNFSINNEDSDENIWVIPYDEIYAPGFQLVHSTLHPAQRSLYKFQEAPWNAYSVMEEFYYFFEEEDIRFNGGNRAYGIMMFGPQFDAFGNVLIDDSADWYPDNAYEGNQRAINFSSHISKLYPDAGRDEGARISKYEIEYGADHHMNNDFAIYRYAEILLNKAEALWRLDPSDQEALMIVNTIRERADIGALSSLIAQDILAERGRELCFEGKRRTDLIRFDQWSKPWWEKPISEDYKKIMPIPVFSLTAGSNLSQNPGY